MGSVSAVSGKFSLSGVSGTLWHVACGNACSRTGFLEPCMMKQSLRLDTIWGIPIGINSSWLLIFVLLTLSLAGHFSSLHPRWAFAYHYTLVVITSLLFFTSVLLHELGHSAVALRKHVPIRSTTLFVFGGVA
jgi:Zn-dependent protease